MGNKLLINLLYKKSGFNLAEVLITLGIIGIVASMTIPTMLADIQQEQNVKTWRKTYSNLSQAFQQVANDNGGSVASGIPFDSSALNSVNYNNFMESMKPYLRHVKTCQMSRAKIDGCYTGTMKALTDAYTIIDYSDRTASMVLPDGVVLFFYAGAPSSCSQNIICNDTHIFVDVNGSKLPNRFGKDVFHIAYNSSKKIFMPNNYSPKACKNEGWGCSEYYLLYDK